MSAFQIGWVDAVPEINVKWLPSVDRNNRTAYGSHEEFQPSRLHQLKYGTSLGTYDVQVQYTNGGRKRTSQLRSVEDAVLDISFLKANGGFYTFIEPKADDMEYLHQRFAANQAYTIEQAAISQLVGTITFGKSWHHHKHLVQYVFLTIRNRRRFEIGKQRRHPNKDKRKPAFRSTDDLHIRINITAQSFEDYLKKRHLRHHAE
jgi:hypothetical protein